MAERYVSIREAAERYRMTYGYFWTLIRQDRLRAVRVGKTWRIPESALEELESGEENQTTTQ